MGGGKMKNTKCPHCGKEINPASLLGKMTSEKKATSSAENGKKGGRPHAVIKKTDIKIKPYYKDKPERHLTGWRLFYTLPDGEEIERFFQIGFYDLKKAKHVFFMDISKSGIANEAKAKMEAKK
jgi:hypothetical protein